MTSEAQKAAKARYDANTARYYSLKLNGNTDSLLIEHLDKHGNVQGYLKNLIRQDMMRENALAQNDETFDATMNLYNALRK